MVFVRFLIQDSDAILFARFVFASIHPLKDFVSCLHYVLLPNSWCLLIVVKLNLDLLPLTAGPRKQLDTFLFHSLSLFFMEYFQINFPWKQKSRQSMSFYLWFWLVLITIESFAMSWLPFKICRALELSMKILSGPLIVIMCCKSNLDFIWMRDNPLKKAQCLQQPLHHRFKFGSLLSTANIFPALWLAGFPAGPHSRPMRSQDSLLLLESAVRERRSEQHAVKKEQCSRPSKSSVSAEAFTSDGEKSIFWGFWGEGSYFTDFFPWIFR